MSDYRTEVKEDIKRYCEDHEYYINYADFDTPEEFGEWLNDELWACDDVTGNASGSYTFNSYEAREKVLADIDTVKEALEEFGVSAEEIGEKFLAEDWEYLDVTARCYVLGECIAEFIDEYADLIADAIADSKEEAEM